MIPRAGQSPSIPQAQCKISVWKELAGTGDGSIMLLSGAYSRLLGAAAVAGSKEGVVSSCPSWAKEPGAVALQGLGSRLFRCVLRRGEVELEAQVEVTLEYPTRPPLFTLMHMQWPATEDGGCNAPMARLPKAELAALEAEVSLRALFAAHFAWLCRQAADPGMSGSSDPRFLSADNKNDCIAFLSQLNLGSVAVMSKRCPDAHQLLVQRLAALMSAFDLYVEQALSQRSLLASGLQTRVPATRGRELRRPLAGGDDFAQRA